MNQDISLLAMSNEVDYDQDGESSMLTFLHNSGYTGIRGILCIFRSSLSNYKTSQLKVSKCLELQNLGTPRVFDNSSADCPDNF